MKRFIPIAAVVAALALTAPATATWYSGGDHEPDNPLDVEAYIWQEPPGTERNRIYFNVYAHESGTNFNPNVGALETRWDVWPRLAFEAHFGVWVDCNQDGYIGMAESAVREYRKELLPENHICPETSGNNFNFYPQGAHNYRGWVTELIPIARGPSQGDARVIKDPDAKVWGDRTLPYPTGPTTGSGSCPLVPFPKGTWQSTGGIVDYADCFISHRLGETYNTVVTTAGQDDLALDNASTWKQPGHPLNVGTFGSPRAEDGVVTAQDCSEDPIFTVGDASKGTPAESAAKDFEKTGVRMPGSGVNTDGGIAGTYNNTAEALREDCDTSNDDEGDFYRDVMFEAEHEEVSSRWKIRAEYNFNFSMMSRGGAPLLGLGALGKTGGPSDGGLEHLEPALAQQSEWNGGSSLVGYTPDVSDGSVRGTVEGDDPLVIADATFFTFYAYAGSATLASGYVTPPGTGFYGSDFCPDGTGTGAGTHYGWECDRNKWYKQENGEEETLYFPHAYPGDPYQFRDVDCFDGGFQAGTDDTFSFGEFGILPAYYGSHPCSNPPASSASS